MTRIELKAALAAFCLGAAMSAPAALRFDNLFQDHAVLQQGRTIPVWGYGGVVGNRLQATLNGVDSWTKVNLSGEFSFRLPAARAGGPYVLEVKRPIHVLYAWALNPTGANLCNTEGLPAATFSW